jgi:hypothetical protein
MRYLLVAALCGCAFAQQTQFAGQSVTGQLTLVRTVNLRQAALAPQGAAALGVAKAVNGARQIPRLKPPSLRPLGAVTAAPLSPLGVAGMTVAPAVNTPTFRGLTHLEQRQANGGNQFNVEPPSQGLAVANGYILEGVNNAIQVYDTSGTPQLPAVLSTNQVFGLAPAINWNTGVNGVFPTDIRVFYDQGYGRWFILQRAQDNDAAGTLLNSSHVYLAVSQTGDPTATYNIYVMDTTNAQNGGCPCFSDYLQIGADQYGFYITANEFGTYYPQFIDATILAVSKAGLASGSNTPAAYRFTLPFYTGYEFAVQPAATPPGGSNFLASGGVEYFLSTQAAYSYDGNVALWAMSNTASLGTTNPSPALVQTIIPALTYIFPDVATQPGGPLPYGSTLSPPGLLEFLDGGDSRVLSLSYASGRLFATFATQVLDDSAHSLVAGAYVVISPTLRAGALGGSVLRQGYLTAKNNHVLRPAVAVNSQGRGAIVFTLVGQDYYPSVAYVTIDAQTTGAVMQLAAAGAYPEDGFSGYGAPGMQGVARWGDYSAAVAASDGAIWMATEYIPDAPRALLANWGTLVARYRP